MMQKFVLSAFLLVLTGCATTVSETRENPSTPAAPGAPGSRYVQEPLRGAGAVEQMRAAPAPAIPELAAGRNAVGDRNRLASQGYVLIGTGYFQGAPETVRDRAIGQGQQVGAERIVLYAPQAGTASLGDWRANYFVRFQLPFGAMFRDLHEEERALLGAPGGVEIGSIVDGTPASRANLRDGDFVLKFDGKPIPDRNAFQSLLKSHAGHPVTLTIVRNGETLQRVVRLGPMAR